MDGITSAGLGGTGAIPTHSGWTSKALAKLTVPLVGSVFFFFVIVVVSFCVFAKWRKEEGDFRQKEQGVK